MGCAPDFDALTRPFRLEGQDDDTVELDGRLQMSSRGHLAALLQRHPESLAACTDCPMRAENMTSSLTEPLEAQQ